MLEQRSAAGTASSCVKQMLHEDRLVIACLMAVLGLRAMAMHDWHALPGTCANEKCGSKLAMEALCASLLF